MPIIYHDADRLAKKTQELKDYTLWFYRIMAMDSNPYMTPVMQAEEFDKALEQIRQERPNFGEWGADSIDRETIRWKVEANRKQKPITYEIARGQTLCRNLAEEDKTDRNFDIEQTTFEGV